MGKDAPIPAAEPILKIIMLKKIAPYNSGEMRGIRESRAKYYVAFGLAQAVGWSLGEHEVKAIRSRERRPPA